MAAETSDRAPVENKLASFSIQTLEEAIANAVSALAGTAYRCSIQTVSYRGGHNGSAKVKLTLSEPVDVTILHRHKGNKIL